MTATLVASPADEPRPTTVPSSRRPVASGVKRGKGRLVVESYVPKPLPAATRSRRRTMTVRGW